MNLQNFGEQFSSGVLTKTYQRSLVDGLTNRDYEGEIKKPGDRVNILSFLNSILLNDYVVGTDMASETIVDAEDQLIVEKRKYYNFSLDRLEDLFTYGGNIPENLLNDSSMVLERIIDTYILDKFGSEVKAGSWVGTDLVVYGSGQTMASITTTSTGGTVTITTYSEQVLGLTPIQTVENPRDGLSYSIAFNESMLYKGFRLRSTAAFVSPWYRISGITSSVVATLTEWDEATAGSDFEEGHTLRGLFGGDGRTFPKYGDGNNAPLITMSGLGWEIQAAIATAVTAAVIYDQTTLLAEALGENEVPEESRKLTLPIPAVTMLKQASELQPTGIGEIYSGVVLNGKVMRIGGFDVHQAAGARVSTRASLGTASGNGADTTITAGPTGYIIPANHIAMMTFAEKWTESRVVDAENQFAKKYQGLFLFGAKVPRYRRKYGAVLFGSI